MMRAALDLDELAKAYPTVEKTKLAEAFELLKKLVEAGIPLEECEPRGFTRRGAAFPAPKDDPRTVKLRATL